MARFIRRPLQQAGFLTAEFSLAPGETVVFPVRRSISKSGDSTIAIMAPPGTLVSHTIEPYDTYQAFLREHDAENQAYVSSETGEYPAIEDPDSWARVWVTNHAIEEGEIFQNHNHATFIRITNGELPGWVVLYGDY